MPKNRILKLADGRYQYQATDTTGKRHTLKSRKNETKKDFSGRCDELDALMAKGSIGQLKTMDDLFTAWMESHAKVMLSKSDTDLSARVYRDFIQPYLGHIRLEEIDRAMVYRVLSQAYQSVPGGASKSYVDKMRGTISRPFNWALDSLGLDLISPTQGLVFKVPEKAKRKRIISPEEWATIQEAGKYSKYLTYIQVLYQTGLRPSEGLGLQARDIKPDRLEIRRGMTEDGLTDLKTINADRELPLAPRLKRLLQAQALETGMLSKERWLFPTAQGIPAMSAAVSALQRIMRRTAVYKRGGHNGLKKLAVITPPLHYTLYDFRHTFATRMVEAGMPLKTLQYIMGHEDVSTTMQYYTEVTPKMLEDAVDFMDVI